MKFIQLTTTSPFSAAKTPNPQWYQHNSSFALFHYIDTIAWEWQDQHFTSNVTTEFNFNFKNVQPNACILKSLEIVSLSVIMHELDTHLGSFVSFHFQFLEIAFLYLSKIFTCFQNKVYYTRNMQSSLTSSFGTFHPLLRLTLRSKYYYCLFHRWGKMRLW